MDVTYGLANLSDGAVFHAGVAELTSLQGLTAMRVALTERMTRYDVPGSGPLDLPTFISLPIWFEDGTIEVDVLGLTNHDAAESTQPMAGLAYRMGADRARFDAVEVRTLSGTSIDPPSSRARRAAQFVAYPEWPFETLWPVPGADVPDFWTHLTVHIDGNRLAALVDGVESIVIPVVKAAALRGDVGLFVDVGTEAYFANLKVTPA